MSEKLRVGILGATGMVGQRFISLLENHPTESSPQADKSDGNSPTVNGGNTNVTICGR